MAWVEKRASGKWTGKYRTSNGSKRTAGTHAHKEKAYALAVEAEQKAQAPGWRDPRALERTWGDWCETWWPTRTVEASTLRADTSIRKRHLSYWDERPLGEIDRFAVKEWVSALRAKGLAHSSVARIVRLFSASLSAAVDAQIMYANPAFRLGVSPPDPDTMRFFTRKEVKRMLKRLAHRPEDAALLALLVGTGLRFGEAAALSAENVDFKRKVIRVAATRDQSTGRIKKYPKGRQPRTVPLPDDVASRIKPYVKRQGKEGMDSVFGRVDSANWRKRVWLSLETGGTPHDLRHTYASWLLQAGVPLAEVSRLLGHKSQRITERYAHLGELPNDAVRAVIRL